MAFTATITETINIGGEQVSRTNSYTNSAETNIDEAVPTGQTVQIALVQDVDQTSIVYIVSDQDVELDFNVDQAGVPAISALAGVPYVWHTNNYFTDLLGTDITKLFVTNTSGTTANVKIRFLYDSTP